MAFRPPHSIINKVFLGAVKELVEYSVVEQAWAPALRPSSDQLVFCGSYPAYALPHLELVRIVPGDYSTAFRPKLPLGPCAGGTITAFPKMMNCSGTPRGDLE